MKRFGLIICLLPQITFASLGEELNSMLQNFFGDPETTKEQPLADPVESPVEFPVETLIETPIDFEALDISELKQQIFFEESVLADIEAEIQIQQSQIEATRAENTSQETDLFLLDSTLPSIEKKLKKYQELEVKWKQELENITRERSEIRAHIRVNQRDYEKFMTRNYIRKESFSAEEEVSVLKWLFSDKTVSEILEDQRKNTQRASKEKDFLQQLNYLRYKLAKKEKSTAYLFSKLSQLHLEAANEKHLFSGLARRKAQQIAGTKAQLEIESDMLEQKREEQAESTIYLQTLRQQLDSEPMEFAVEEPVEPKVKVLPFFDFPVAGGIQLNAQFRDAAYKKEFDKTHEGLDFEAEQGSDVLAGADGEVNTIGQGGYGYSYIIIKHKKGFYSVYGHVSKILVKKGQTVKVGDLIAKSGGTPGTKGAGFFTSGPHLHFEVFRDGQYLDPINYLPKITRN